MFVYVEVLQVEYHLLLVFPPAMPRLFLTKKGNVLASVTTHNLTSFPPEKLIKKVKMYTKEKENSKAKSIFGSPLIVACWQDV